MTSQGFEKNGLNRVLGMLIAASAFVVYGNAFAAHTPYCEPVECDGETYAHLVYDDVDINFVLADGYEDAHVAIEMTDTNEFLFTTKKNSDVEGSLTIINQLVATLTYDINGDGLEDGGAHPDSTETTSDDTIDFDLFTTTALDQFTFTTEPDPVCADQEIAHVTAYKVVCDDEAYLPDWAGADVTITPELVEEFVENNSEHCEFADDHNFQVAPLSAQDPGDMFYGEAAGEWVTYGPTDAHGKITINVDLETMTSIQVREVLKDGYIPFTHDTTNSDVSAEIYCHTDVANYDNLEWIQNLEDDSSYYCVAFNAPQEDDQPEVTPEQCDGETYAHLIYDDVDTYFVLADGYEDTHVAIEMTDTNEFEFTAKKDSDVDGSLTIINQLVETLTYATNGDGLENSGVHPDSAETTTDTTIEFDLLTTTALDQFTFTTETDPTCVEVETVNLVAYKVVCDDEAYLPNWQGADVTITPELVEDFVEDNSDHCQFAREWDFEWAPGTTPKPTQDIYGEAGGEWTTFGSTNADGKTSTQVAIDGLSTIRVREVLKDGFIPFTDDNSDDETAEMYCHTDVLNYDNYDEVRNIEDDETYYCVAFNAPEEVKTGKLVINKFVCPEDRYEGLTEKQIQKVMKKVENGTLNKSHLTKLGCEEGEGYHFGVQPENPEMAYGLTASGDVYLIGSTAANGKVAIQLPEGKYHVGEVEDGTWTDEADMLTLQCKGPHGPVIYDAVEFDEENKSSIVPQELVQENEFFNPQHIYIDEEKATHCLAVNLVEVEDEPEVCTEYAIDYADSVISHTQGKRKNGSNVLPVRSNPSDVLGSPDGDGYPAEGFYSLGFGGNVVVYFDYPVYNMEGGDISVHEITNGRRSYANETATVEASKDRITWKMLGSVSNATEVSYVDLEDGDLDRAQYVRITDTTNPALHNNSADGFDLDAVNAEYVCSEYADPDDQDDDEEPVCEDPNTYARVIFTDIADGNANGTVTDSVRVDGMIYESGNWFPVNDITDPALPSDLEGLAIQRMNGNLYVYLPGQGKDDLDMVAGYIEFYNADTVSITDGVNENKLERTHKDYPDVADIASESTVDFMLQTTSKNDAFTITTVEDIETCEDNIVVTPKEEEKKPKKAKKNKSGQISTILNSFVQTNTQSNSQNNFVVLLNTGNKNKIKINNQNVLFVRGNQTFWGAF